MTEPAPAIDLANLPAPNQGILVALFITVRKHDLDVHELASR